MYIVKKICKNFNDENCTYSVDSENLTTENTEKKPRSGKTGGGEEPENHSGLSLRGIA